MKPDDAIHEAVMAVHSRLSERAMELNPQCLSLLCECQMHLESACSAWKLYSFLCNRIDGPDWRPAPVPDAVDLFNALQRKMNDFNP